MAETSQQQAPETATTSPQTAPQIGAAAPAPQSGGRTGRGSSAGMQPPPAVTGQAAPQADAAKQGQAGAATPGNAAKAGDGGKAAGKPGDAKSGGAKPAPASGAMASPLGGDVGAAGAKAGAAIQKSTMKPGGIAEQGFTGTPRPVPYQREMEQSFGADFSHVKVYTDAQAKQANEKLGARAYAMDDKIAFNTSNPDRAMVAHELTHVLQHGGKGGARPSSGETDGRGLDMAGEHEAEAVQSAVGGGKAASSALSGSAPSSGGAGKKKGPARSADGSAFSYGLTFSSEAFKTGGSYQLWAGGPFEWPTPFPPVMAFVSPSATISADVGANWGAEELPDQGLTVAVAVAGGVGIGLQAGSQQVAAAYGEIAANITGGFTYTLDKETWKLQGDIKLSAAVSVGVKVAGGVIDYKFELGSIDNIATLASITWENGNFSAGTFSWGPEMQSMFQMISEAINQGQQLVDAGISLATEGVEAATQVIGSAADWTTNAFDTVMGGAGALISGAGDAIGSAAGAVGDAVDSLPW